MMVQDDLFSQNSVTFLTSDFTQEMWQKYITSVHVQRGPG
jgi:hypothetical protein